MKKLFLLFIFVPILAFSQVGGESIYNFLNLTGSARQASLGGNALTLIDDVNQAFWNPSIINQSLDNQFAINYLNYISDINYVSASFAHMISRNFGTFHTGVTYLNYGRFIGADDLGNETATFNAYDLSFSIGYAYNIPKSDFFVGANFKLIQSSIASYSSFGVGSDLGILYYNENEPYIFTLVLRNFGYQISTYSDIREKLPFQIDFGGSYRLEHVPLKWYVTISDIQKWQQAVSNPSNSITDINGNISPQKIHFFDNMFRHVSVGAELFPENAFNLRLGYNFKRGQELKLVDQRTFAGFTAGFGLKLNKVKLNYAFTKYHPASNASTLSLQINLN